MKGNRRINETGKIYGKLRVVRLNEEKGKDIGSYYDCVCVCGKEVPIRGTFLRNGKKTSCGCDKSIPGLDEKGKRYGKWTVLDISTRVKKNGELYLDCRCDCGAERPVLRGSLLSGYSQSCGCRRDNAKVAKIFRDLTGQRFGGLIVLGRNYSKQDGKTWWDCVCQCGKKTIMRSDKLVGPPYITSCGCRLTPNEEGNIYGKLRVIGPSELRGGELFWPCFCNCGKTTLKRGVDLRSGHVRACSKGCLNVDRYFETGINELISRTKGSAQRRGLEYNLSRTDHEQIVGMPCAYCRRPPSNELKTLRTKKLKFRYSGIDRIDPRRGYLADNINPCCDTCNTAKGKMDLKQFFDWLSSVRQCMIEQYPDFRK